MRFFGYNTRMKRMILCLLSILFLLGTACAHDPTSPEVIAQSDALELTVFDIGQADSILLQFGACNLLIDAGEQDDGQDLVTRLSELGVEKLDLLLLTHFDKDHIGGADTLIESLPIDQIYLPNYEADSKQYRQLLAAIESAQTPVTRLSADTTLTFGDASLDVWVSTVPYDGSNDNEQSLVVHMAYQQTTYLFLGDAEEALLKNLVYSTRNLTCDIMKLPHHGVYDKNLPMLLTFSLPDYVLITDSTKHPADSATLEALDFVEANVQRTMNGEIHLTIVNGNVVVN